MLVPEGDVEALAAAANVIMWIPTDSRHGDVGLGSSAQARTWSKIAAKQVDLYRAALEAGRPPPRPGSPRTLRQRAIEEFGRPAETLAVQPDRSPSPTSDAPTALSRVLGSTMDALAEARAKVAGKG